MKFSVQLDVFYGLRSELGLKDLSMIIQPSFIYCGADIFSFRVKASRNIFIGFVHVLHRYAHLGLVLHDPVVSSVKLSKTFQNLRGFEEAKYYHYKTRLLRHSIDDSPARILSSGNMLSSNALTLSGHPHAHSVVLFLRSYLGRCVSRSSARL